MNTDVSLSTETLAPITDVVIAAGLLGSAGHTVINGARGLAVRRDDDHYEVLWNTLDQWESVMRIELTPGRDPVISHFLSGAWTRSLTLWAFEFPDESVSTGHLIEPSSPPRAPASTHRASPFEVRARLLGASAQRDLKTRAWRVLRDPKWSPEIRTQAAQLILRAWFDRSLGAHINRGLGYPSHPDFHTYAAMLLNDPAACEVTFHDMVIVNRLIDRYGTRPGLEGGGAYWITAEDNQRWRTTHEIHRPFGPEDLRDDFPR